MEKAELTIDRNIFRQAKQLLDNKGDQEMSEEEKKLLSAATIPLVILPRFNDTLTGEGLEELAKLIEESHK
ncbi:hypothetical protein ES704_01645 [subsurface metagenome]|jgi:hypothetical protein